VKNWSASPLYFDVVLHSLNNFFSTTYLCIKVDEFVKFVLSLAFSIKKKKKKLINQKKKKNKIKKNKKNLEKINEKKKKKN